MVTKEMNLAEKYNRPALENVLRRRFFVIPSFEIYNGVAGLYDFGPTGCALKNNIEAFWREHFILEDNLLEISTTCLTPEIVLKTSGHVDKFTDYAVKDLKTGQTFRCDKMIQEWIAKEKKKKNIKPEHVKELNQLNDACEKFEEAEIDEAISKYKIRSPDTGNELGKAYKFNLMFETQIGSSGGVKGYLRPETAQGHFVNFRKLLEFNGGRIPFGSALIGLGFRNEIAPRSGLLRVREFSMAEIEYFVDPENKNHKKYSYVKELKLPLWTSENQMAGKGTINDLTIEEAVNNKVINNETLAYFVSRTYLFLIGIGISKEGIRFRQHTPKEMAHYATDCWDAEVETSYGWIEVAGHADRTCYDLGRHTSVSGVELVAARMLKEPKIVKTIRFSPNKGALFKQYTDKAKAKALVEFLEKVSDEQKEVYMKEYEQNMKIEVDFQGEKITLDGTLICIERVEQKITEEKFTPNVIEPSFGIGRITYCVMEHCFGIRANDNKRTYFSFPPCVAPYKVSVLPLIGNAEMLGFVEPIRKILVANGISYKIDDINDSIGRRYARTDEIGIPFGITIDDITQKDNTVTFRELKTTLQIRVPIDDLGSILRSLSNKLDTWENIMTKYPLFKAKKDDKEDK